jgi:hypothetical protein
MDPRGRQDTEGARRGGLDAMWAALAGILVTVAILGLAFVSARR